MRQTTIGRLLVEQAIPERFRDGRTLDKKGLQSLFAKILAEAPDEYSDISYKLHQVAREIAYRSGGTSFGPEHLRPAEATRAARAELARKLPAAISAGEDAVLALVSEAADKLTKPVYDESLAEKNPFAIQVLSGSRGNPVNLRSLRGFDGLYQDHLGRPVPVPILRNYSEGLGFEEYLAATYGSRQGVVQTKLATADAGYLSKQLVNAAHRLAVRQLDDDHDPDNEKRRGLPVSTSDADSVGSLLAVPAGRYARNTPITAAMLQELRREGLDEILVRSPLVGGPPDGSLYARDAGIRHRGRLAPRGSYVGNAAAQALSEVLTQMQLSSKHSAGIKGSVPTGFPVINQLTQAPDRYPGGATHAEIDGSVTSIEDAPQGGVYITIAGKQHHVGPDNNVSVKVGQVVEAGDVLSDGLPNPRLLVEHKGLGEGRRQMVNLLRDAYEAAGSPASRRNIEVAVRGLLNHAKITDFHEDYLPGDVVPYNLLESSWQSRDDAKPLRPQSAVGQYLEEPTLHYTVGTRIRPSVAAQLQKSGVAEIKVHPQPPPWQPVMIRAEAVASHDPDWQSRMLGPGHQKNLLSDIQRGAVSDPNGSSYVPALVEGATFNESPSRGWQEDWPDDE